MSQVYPLVALGKILNKSEEWIEIKPTEKYKQITVKIWGKGVVLRNEVTGAEIAASKRLKVQSGQFILSRIDARHGAFGLIPDFLEGAIVTNDFPVFTPNHQIILPQFINWISKTKDFIELCKAASEGTTNRVRLKEDKFLAMEISLPPLEEQRRIVARVEELVGKIEEVRSLRLNTLKEVEALMGAEEIKIWTDESLKNAPTLQDVTTYLSRGRQSKQGESKHYLIKTQHVQMNKYVKPQITLAPNIADKVLPEAIAKHGDILIACSAAGCLGRVAYYTDFGIIASTDTHVAIARANRELILPEYLYVYLKSFQGQVQLRSREKGDWTREKIGFRLTELNVADMRKIPVPLVSLPEQHRIVTYLNELQTKIDAMKHLREEAMKEIDALLPSILDKAFKGEL